MPTIQPKYLCVTMESASRGWKADVTIHGKPLRAGSPTMVLHQLTELGYELVSASYSNSFIPVVGNIERHVLWLKSPEGALDEVRPVN